MPQGVYAWSKTAAANSNADSSINWAEGQAPSSVNDSARAVMARIAEYRDDASGSITTTGTATAYAAASNQAFASLVLMDKKAIVIVPHVTSGLSPTLNVDGLGAKPLRASTGAVLAAGAFIAGTPYSVTFFNTVGEWLCDGAALADGDVTTANLADLSVTAAKIADATITAAKIAPGSIGGAAISPSFVPYNTVMINGTIQVTQGGGAMTFIIKTLAGTDPSATDPVTFMFRNQSGPLGDYVVRTLTAPLALAVPNGSTLGFISGVPGRIWLVALDNAGVVELAVFNAVGLLNGIPIGVSNIYPLHAFGEMTTVAMSAASNSAGVFYSNSVRISKAFVPLGYASWEVGFAIVGVAGNWNVLPARLQLFQPGSSPLPGTIVQSAFFATGTFTGTGATVIPADNTIPQITEGDQYMQVGLAPNSSANVLTIGVAANFANGVAPGRVIMALFQDSTANALACSSMQTPTQIAARSTMDYQMQAGTTFVTLFKLRAGPPAANTIQFNGDSAAVFGGALMSSMRVVEIMG